jgi:16S rRNA (cytosine967-C5)-methyltransferase
MNDSASGVAARRLVVDLLERIEGGGAYANIVVPRALDSSELPERDRALVTALTYGTTRMRRSCDWLVDRFLNRSVETRVRSVLRMGAFQLAFTDVPDHAAVSTAVEVTPKRARGFVNAVLRKVAKGDFEWPDEATRLSYPDWIIETLTADHGRKEAVAALERMNQPATVSIRPDGYAQDLASQWVVDEVPAGRGTLVLDCCAAPGGKATALEGGDRIVVAADHELGRAGLITANIERTKSRGVAVIVADGTAQPYRLGSFDSVLVDAPCTGLGVLRRRPDARWRIEPAAVERLARLQSSILEQAALFVAPGGSLTYSVCTLTHAETTDVAGAFSASHPDLVSRPLEAGDRWREWSSGGLLLPQDHDTDGMAIFGWQKSS